MDIDLTARQAVRTGMLVAWLAAWGLLTSAACNSSTPYGINMADGGDSNTQATIRTNDWNAGFRWARIYIRWDKVQQNAPTSTVTRTVVRRWLYSISACCSAVPCCPNGGNHVP